MYSLGLRRGGGIVYSIVDTLGNVRICQSMQSVFRVYQASVLTVWAQTVKPKLDIVEKPEKSSA